LFLSYYNFNSIEIIIIGLLLLFGSLFCINLFFFVKKFNLSKYNNFLTFFDFFNDFVDYVFLRKQNLHGQNKKEPILKILKKK
jgi:hypothetical protein